MLLFFGVASQRYENKLDRIENRVNALLPLLVNDKTRKNAIGRIGSVQEMGCPIQPNFFEPITNFRSLFGKEHFHGDTVAFLKGVVEDFASVLQGANLMNANLEDANLMDASLVNANLVKANVMKANLMKANLERANLLDAKNLTIEQLCKAKSLYDAKLDPKLFKQVKKEHPKLLENFEKKY